MHSLPLGVLYLLCISFVASHHGHSGDHHNETEGEHRDHDHHSLYPHRNGTHHSKVRTKFLPFGFRYTAPRAERMYVFNTHRYSNWSEWSSCFPMDCVEVRYRRCLDDSWKTPPLDKVHSTKCLSQYYGEKRTCQDKTKCNEHLGEKVIQNLTEICGIRPETSSTTMKITGGKAVQPHSWPWVVRLTVKPPRQEYYTFCGATLIAPQWVLTAAHCVLVENKRIPVGRPVKLADYMKSLIYAHVGDHDKYAKEESEKEYQVTTAILHPKYHRKLQTDGYDIALLKLSKPVTTSESVGFACLPQSELKLKPGTKCWALGWGKSVGGRDLTFDNIDSLLESLFLPFPGIFGRPLPFGRIRNRKREGKGISDDGTTMELHEVELPIISIDACRKHYMDISESVHICAGSKGKDTCEGDSGGGLYCQLPGSDRWSIVGVTSFGLARGCGLNPGVYTSTSAHMDWIYKQLV